MSSAPASVSIAHPITAGIIAAITGFASSFALLIAGLRAVGATEAEAASGLLVLCVFQGVLAISLSLRYRQPLSFAWSTPGAALLVAAHQTTGDFHAAVGAFLLCGLLLLATGLWPWLAGMMTRIPRSIASAMLAGILLPICLAPVQAAIQLPLLALPPLAVWLVLSRFAPRWAVAAAVVVTAVAVVLTSPQIAAVHLLPTIRFVVPGFEPLVLLGLGVPLYIVTMAGQNVPGFAVLRTFGFENPPARAMLTGAGIATTVGSVFGAYALNLSAITAAMMAGPDAHPDPDRRWIATVSSGVSYLVIGLGAGAATALVAASPPILIEAVAGLALLGALINSIVAALEQPAQRVVAIATFLVVASGIQILNVGSAFWGLIVGTIVLLVLTAGRRESTEPAAR